MLRRLYVKQATARVSGRSVQFFSGRADQHPRGLAAVRWTEILALSGLLAACGGGDPDPCAVDPTATVVVGCPACSHNDVSPCPALMPPAPCPASGCSS